MTPGTYVVQVTLTPTTPKPPLKDIGSNGTINVGSGGGNEGGGPVKERA